MTAKSVSILPKLSNEQVQTAEKLIEQKQNLEYGALMILKDLHKLGLQSILQRAVKNEHMDAEALADYYGDGDDCGHPVSGLTIDKLLDQWDDTTDKMVRALVGR